MRKAFIIADFIKGFYDIIFLFQINLDAGHSIGDSFLVFDSVCTDPSHNEIQFYLCFVGLVADRDTLEKELKGCLVRDGLAMHG